MVHRKFQRMTPQRKIILEELREARFHPTADEIYARVRLRLPRISLGTVYRNLESLAAQGTIRKLDMAGSQRRFDVNTELHHHIRCLRCGALEDVSVGLPYSWEEMLVDTHGYEIQGVHLDIWGFCPKCLEERVSLRENADHNETHTIRRK